MQLSISCTVKESAPCSDCGIAGDAAIPDYIVIGKSKGWPAVDLVAANNLQDCPNIDGCDHACGRLEGRHNKRCHLHGRSDMILKKGPLSSDPMLHSH